MFRIFLFSFFILFSMVLKAETIKNDAVISILDYYNDSFEDFYSKEKGVKKIKEKLDNIIKDEYRIEQIDETNLFKVYNKNKHFYIFPEHDYIFIGKMLKLNDFSFSKVIVDSERKSYNRNLLRMFNESDAIIYKNDKKEKEGRIYVFADFSCPYCKKFHDENLNNLINLGYEVWYLPFLKNPNNLVIKFLSVLCTVFAPSFAIKIVIGTNIKKAGIFIKPKLKGASTPL